MVQRAPEHVISEGSAGILAHRRPDSLEQADDGFEVREGDGVNDRKSAPETIYKADLMAVMDL